MSPKPLTGPEKAVLMLLSLDEEVAEPIVRELGPEHVVKLRQVAENMRAVPAASLPLVYAEFLEKSESAVPVPAGVVDFIQRVATRALGEPRANELFGHKVPSSLERIAAADARALAGLLRAEDPQLVAALLSQLTPEQAAAVVERLPEESRSGVLSRMGVLKGVPAELISEIADAIAAELPEPGAGQLQVDGVAHSAALVRSLSKETCELVLGDIEAENESLAAEIRQAMYAFEDLKSMDPKSMRELLKAVPGDRLTLAMKTASPEMGALIYGGMSKRAAERLREDLTLLGAVRLSEVEQAQREIVEIALRLESEGTLSLGVGGEALV